MRLSSFETLAAAAWVAVAAASRLPLACVETVKLCAFRTVTGLPCPGCGMGHALLLAFNGRFADSFAAHPLGLPLLSVWTAWLCWGLANAARGRAFSDGFPRPRARSGAFALAALLGVYGVRLARAVDFQVPVAHGKPVPGEFDSDLKKWGTEAQKAALAALPAPGASFRFAVIGDAEPGRFPWERPFAPGPGAFWKLISQAQGSGAAFVLQLGDMVSKGTSENYRAHFDGMAKSSKAPLFETIGNHDRSRPNGSATKTLYTSAVGPLDFYFDYAGWRFVSVDTSDRRLRGDQMAWLKTVVTGDGKCVVFTHVPPKALKGKFYSPKKPRKAFEKEEEEPPLPKSEDYWHDVLTAYFEDNSAAFMALMSERKVARVYTGHIHAFGVARAGPTLFVLSGGGGSPLYPLPPGEPKRKMTHWLEVSVAGETVSETVHELNGDLYPMPLPR